MGRGTWCVAAVLAVSGCRGGEAAKEAKTAAAEEGSEAKTVVLSPEALKAAGIETAAVSRGAFGGRLSAPAVIRPDAQQSVVVRARADGRVLRVLADVGSRVAQGDPLTVLEGPDATAALARYRAAAARETATQKNLERAGRLLEAQAISRADRDARLAEAEAAGAEAEASRQDLARLGLDPAARVDAG